MTTKTKSFPVALITGASRRLGAAITKKLHALGYRVIVHYNNSASDAEQLCASLNAFRENSAHPIQADLGQQKEIEKLAQSAIAHWQGIDLLINNASTFYPRAFEQTTETDWADLLSSNLKAPFFLSQQLTQTLVHNQGCIINISDVFAQRPRKGFSAYCIAKAGNEMMTKALALELAPNIRVNGVAPGAILWPEDAAGNAIENPSMLEDIPLRRLGGEKAIADAVAFLADTQSSYTTGQILNIDGGRTLQQ